MSRHAIITGAGGGVGQAIARALFAAGVRLTLLGRNEAALRRVSDACGGAHWVIADVSRDSHVCAAFDAAREHHGPVAILINAAGIAPSAPFLAIDNTQWRQTLATNLDGPFFCMRAALPDMLAAKWGRIVNIASTAGLKGYAYVAAYCASKHGLVGLTRAAAQDVAREGVTVNAICPGFLDTDMTAQSIARITEKTGLDPTAARDALVRNNPQGRLIKPDEVASLAAWLCGEASASVNGAAFSVAGGEA